MTLRIPLYLALVLLLSLCVVSLAQQPPAPPQPATAAAPPAPPEPAVAPVIAPGPAPASPPAPSQEPDAPDTPDAPEAPTAFSFFIDGDSFLGIYPEEVNNGNMKQYGLNEPRGVAVGRVIEGGPAERAGLRKNDVILRFNGEEVTSVRKLNRLIGEVAPDHTARLTISRGGGEQEVTVTLAKREDFPRSLNMTAPGRGLDRLGAELGQLGDAPGIDPGDFSLVFGANRRIGIGTTPLTKQLAEYFGVSEGRGVLVASVGENSPASRAGLKAGDVITAVDGNRIERAADLLRELNRKSEGEVTLTIIRDRSKRTFKLTPERGRTFEFGPEIAPQVGQLVLPQIALPKMALPALPAIRLERMPKIALPKITLPAMPKMKGMVLPRLPVLRIRPGKRMPL
ncbi:MAG TPA: PDZ domain-containing protein [Pyrinomonadaceae bacterium]|jgi:membrane-associated protease RseP (regulator of RpoE activity)|nr:PDZ domain-containing protein [Pyrinomonadaceae bacterium]